MSGDLRRTVLLVDEDEATLRATREVLEGAGFRVIARTTVASATSDLSWCHPDAVVLDDAPVGQNIGALIPLLRGPDQSRAVVLYSSTELSQLVPKAAQAGADGYAAKRAGVFRLMQELRHALGEAADAGGRCVLAGAPSHAQSGSQPRIRVRSEPVPPSVPGLGRPSQSGTFQAVTAPPKRMPRLLLIDDELSILSAFRRLLQREGFICDYVLSGREALRRIRSNDPPDVVVSDVIMRAPNGSDVFREIYAEDPGWERRYVFVTGDPSTARPLIRHTSENVTILAKPVSSNQLLEAIRSRLARAS